MQETTSTAHQMSRRTVALSGGVGPKSARKSPAISPTAERQKQHARISQTGVLGCGFMVFCFFAGHFFAPSSLIDWSL